jgi:hypothetical protein
MEFTMVPEIWLRRLRDASHATFRLAIALLRLNYRHHNHAFRLTNPPLEDMGVATRSKWRSLKELEGRGLIAVERRGLKTSPTVKVLQAPNRLLKGKTEKKEKRDT